MRFALLAILSLLTLLSLGCGATSPRVRREIALLRGEIVDLENQYYTLKSMYRDETGREPDFSSYGMPEGKSRNWRNGPGATRHCLECGQVHDPQMDYDHPLSLDSSTPSENIEPVPADDNRLLQPGESEFEQLDDPVIEIGPEEVPLPSDGQSRGFRQPAEQVSATERNNGKQVLPASRSAVAKGGGIADFEIDTSATNGFEQDGIPGDDGVTVRLLTDFGNQADRRIGELTFSVIDPDQPQATQRLGLWKYSPEEASQLLRSAGGKSMLEARLPWQKGSAQHENLLLFVRVRTADGRTLERSASILVRTEQSAASDSAVEGGQTDPAIDSGRQTDGAAPNWRPIR
jgi:hypothetical protein